MIREMSYVGVPTYECQIKDDVHLTEAMQPLVKRNSWTATTVATIGVVLFIFAVLIAISPRMHGPLLRASSSDVIERVKDNDVYNAAQCIRNTGGTCNLLDCHADRGAVNCTYWYPGASSYCMCQPGFCTALDGHCHRSRNRLVGERVLIKNHAWPDHHMHMLGSVINVTDQPPTDAGRWNVYTFSDIPGEFIITNVKFQDYVLSIKEVDRYEYHNYGQVADGSVLYKPIVKWISALVSSDITLIKSDQSHTSVFTLENLRFPKKFFYLASLLWEVSITEYSDGKLAPEAYWFFDPPLKNDFNATVGK